MQAEATAAYQVRVQQRLALHHRNERSTDITGFNGSNTSSGSCSD
jgi:hypothetical protein